MKIFVASCLYPRARLGQTATGPASGPSLGSGQRPIATAAHFAADFLNKIGATSPLARASGSDVGTVEVALEQGMGLAAENDLAAAIRLHGNPRSLLTRLAVEL